MDPWLQRRVAVLGWYHVYMRSPVMHRCIGTDVFKLILAYLDVIDLRYPLEFGTQTITLRYLASFDSFSWRISDENGRSPCHVCLRPCDGYDVLCNLHRMTVPCDVCTRAFCTGQNEACRRYLHWNVWKCPQSMRTVGCNCISFEMDGSCVRKIKHVILPHA